MEAILILLAVGLGLGAGVFLGGKLGKKLLLVRDVMHAGDAIPTATAETKVGEIILIMTHKTFGCCVSIFIVPKYGICTNSLEWRF